MLDIHHARQLVQATEHARRLSRIIEAGALVAVCVCAVLVAHIHHVLKLVSTAEDSRMAACIHSPYLQFL